MLIFVIEKKDFSYEYYKEALLRLKKTHSFSFFENISKNDIILRHDIDIALKPALNIAELESKIGVYSTYFILFHSPFYNPFSTTSSKIIKKIMNLGHKIGLHYDTSFILENKLHPEETISQELKLISQHFDEQINVISAHNPTTNQKISLKLIKKIIDADSPKLKKDRKYISDSVQNWREGSFSKFVSINQLYILTHPIWWTKQGKTRKEILQSLVGGTLDQHKNEIADLKKLQNNYLHNLKIKRK